MQNVDVTTMSESEFLELMVLRIKKDAVEQIIDYVEGWTKSSNEANLIKKYQARLAIIQTTILDPLEQKLKVTPARQFRTVLESALKLAKEMAYMKLKGLTDMLAAHKASPDWNKGKPHILANKLRDLLKKIISIDTLALLNSKLTEIYNLVTKIPNNNLVIKELEMLKKLVQEIKSKASSTQSKINGLQALTIIGEKEKQL